MLLAVLKQKGIKILVFGFDQRPIVRAYITGDVTIAEIKKSFIKERRVIIKSIKDNPILIIDEYIHSGAGIFSSKSFFEDLGAKKVYTAAFSGNRYLSKNIDIFFGSDGIMYGSGTLLGKYKRLATNEFENELRTRTKVIRSKYKVMNDTYNQLIKDYKEFMKNIALGKIK